jgi:hypothetical protein
MLMSPQQNARINHKVKLLIAAFKMWRVHIFFNHSNIKMWFM